MKKSNILYYFALCLLVIIFCSFKASAAASNKVEENIPLTALNTQNHKFDLRIDTKSPNITLVIDGKNQINFYQNLPIKTLEYAPNKILVFTRPLFKDGFSIYKIDTKTLFCSEVELPSFFKAHGYFKEAIKHNNDIYFINYHRKKFFKDSIGDSNSMYRLKFREKSLNFDPDFNIKLEKDHDIRYGIDRKIFVSSLNKNSLLVCSDCNCSQIDTNENSSTSLKLL